MIMTQAVAKLAAQPNSTADSRPDSRPDSKPAPPARQRSKAPGPRANKFLEYNRDHPRLTVSLQQQYGDVVRHRIGPLLIHQVTHPDLIRHVLLEAPHDYRRGRFYEGFQAFFGEGLLTTDGEQWKRHREVSRPVFHQQRIEQLSPAMTDAAAELADRLSRLARQGVAFDLVPEAMWYTISVLGRCLFTADLGLAADRISPAVLTGMELIIQRMNPVNAAIPTWLPTRHNVKLGRARRVLHEVIGQVIDEHRASPRDDLVSRHIAAADGDRRLLTDGEVHDGLTTTFLAGHETTGTSLAWTLYTLAVNPAVRRAVEDEADAVLGGRPATFADLPKLAYTRMVVEESLRLYPPIWLYPREAITDTEIGGYHIPARSTVFITPYATHRHPKFWENPEAFDPERFRPEQVAARHRHSYLPFGFGQRQCIGKHIALLQLQIAVATVAQQVRLHLVPGVPVSYRAKLSLRPRQAPQPTVQMTAHRRAA
jgi:cytochrome P450